MNEVNTTYDVFLSYNNRDHAAVEVIARQLEQRGLTVFLDRWFLVPGKPWPQALEEILNSCRAVAVFLGPNGMGRWQQREQYLALDNQARRPAFPVIPVLLPGADPALGFLSLNTWVDLRQGSDEMALAILAAAIQGQPPGPDLQRRTATALASICPYRGLRFFREEDAAFFFGRDAFIERLANAVEQHALVAVVGASGSGKSSVVRAGLVPRLRRGDDKKVWEIATLVPGDRPLQSLAAVLVPLLEPVMTEIDRLREIGKLAEALGSGEINLRDVVARALEKQPGTDRLMLVVDQWEEIYTLTRDEQVRQRFLEQLLDASSSGTLSLILTLRGDFFDEVLGYRPLSDRLQGAVVNISRMNREELKQAIESPAHKVGLKFESGLVNRILDKVQGHPGSLPLLEFVLMELWKERQDELLTHAAYEKLGELQGAIAAHAEAIFTSLTQPEQETAQRVFLQLVRPGVGSDSDAPDSEIEPTRRRTSFNELGVDSLPVVRKLADAHLIVTGRNEATGEEVVDLVHEALIRAWSRLSQWIKDDRKFLMWREQLRALMGISAASNYEKSTLLQGSLLAEAKTQLQKRKADLSASEQQYIQTSINARHSQKMRQAIYAAAAVIFPLIVIIVYLSLYGKQKPDNINNNQLTNINAPAASDSPKPVPTATVVLPPLESVVVPTGVVTIPVVVHVVYNTNAENISDKQIKSQIDVLNKDFRAKNDLSKVPAAFKDAIGDAHIEFVLATTDPQGNPTNGITRVKTEAGEFSSHDEVKFRVTGGEDAWPSDKYLNIWVCTLAVGQLDYAQFPGGPPETDGVVILNTAFGTTGTAIAPLNLGHTATHAIALYLNLRHLWGDTDDCTGTDFVDDTPPQKEPNYGHPTFPHISCNNGPNGDMFMNFLDYTDDAVTCMFTKGQVLRMHQTLQGPRSKLGIR